MVKTLVRDHLGLIDLREVSLYACSNLQLFLCRQNVDLFKDKAWHQMCILWSTKTAAWSIYIDGKRDAYGTYNDFLGRRLGTLEIVNSKSRNKMLMTQVNLWDRVLNNQEIEAFSKSCNNGIGSLLSWADLYDVAKKSRYIKPSSCQANPEALSTTVTPPPTTVTTTQAVTTKPPAQGKRGFGLNYGMRRQAKGYDTNEMTFIQMPVK